MTISVSKFKLGRIAETVYVYLCAAVGFTLLAFAFRDIFIGSEMSPALFYAGVPNSSLATGSMLHTFLRLGWTFGDPFLNVRRMLCEAAVLFSAPFILLNLRKGMRPLLKCMKVLPVVALLIMTYFCSWYGLASRDIEMFAIYVVACLAVTAIQSVCVMVLDWRFGNTALAFSFIGLPLVIIAALSLGSARDVSRQLQVVHSGQKFSLNDDVDVSSPLQLFSDNSQTLSTAKMVAVEDGLEISNPKEMTVRAGDSVLVSSFGAPEYEFTVIGRAKRPDFRYLVKVAGPAEDSRFLMDGRTLAAVIRLSHDKDAATKLNAHKAAKLSDEVSSVVPF